MKGAGGWVTGRRREVGVGVGAFVGLRDERSGPHARPPARCVESLPFPPCLDCRTATPEPPRAPTRNGQSVGAERRAKHQQRRRQGPHCARAGPAEASGRHPDPNEPRLRGRGHFRGRNSGQSVAVSHFNGVSSPWIVCGGILNAQSTRDNRPRGLVQAGPGVWVTAGRSAAELLRRGALCRQMRVCLR